MSKCEIQRQRLIPIDFLNRMQRLFNAMPSVPLLSKTDRPLASSSNSPEKHRQTNMLECLSNIYLYLLYMLSLSLDMF